MERICAKSCFSFFSLDTSYRKLAEELNVPKTILQRHENRYAKGLTMHSKGRASVFTEGEKRELKDCIVDLADLDFAPTLQDIQEIVCNYVTANNHEKGMSTFHYKGVSGYPGPDWLQKFMTDQNLSLKYATKLCKACPNATKIPFIINHGYDLLEKTISNLQLKNRPYLIWNVDESGLYSEPKKCRVVSEKGQKTLQIVTGSERDNTTVLATVSANGTTLPPLIIFQCKQVQTTWKPSSDPTSEHFPWIYANESAWMKADVFHK